MDRLRFALPLLIAAVGVAAWCYFGAVDQPDSSPAPAGSHSGDSKTPALTTDPGTQVTPPPAAVPPPAPITISGPLPAPNPPSPKRESPPMVVPKSLRPPPGPENPAAKEVESLALNIRQYQLRFGGNPVGTNAEIVRELNGGNEKAASYLPADLKRLNDQGELTDTWGTPYFFHQEAADKMEVRSAGPDRVLWTTDDLVAR